MSQTTPYNATGRRKTAIAHAWLTEGSGRITINRRGFEEYLPTVQLQNAVYHRIGTIFIKESKVSDSLQGTENTRQSVGEIYSQERWLYLKYSCYQVCRSLFG